MKSFLTKMYEMTKLAALDEKTKFTLFDKKTDTMSNKFKFCNILQ